MGLRLFFKALDNSLAFALNVSMESPCSILGTSLLVLPGLCCVVAVGGDAWLTRLWSCHIFSAIWDVQFEDKHPFKSSGSMLTVE